MGKILNWIKFRKDSLKRKITYVARKLKRKATRRYPPIKAVVVDVDGTLLLENVYDRIAKSHPEFPDRKGKFMGDFNKGIISFNEALAGIADIYAGGTISKREIQNAVEAAIREGNLNKPLVNALKELQTKGIKIIVATRTSGFVADYLRQRLGFDHAVGTQHRYDRYGRLVGNDFFIGMKKGKVGIKPVYTKSEYIKNEFGFKPKEVALISDEMSDFIRDKSAYNIFFDPKNPLYPPYTEPTRKYKMYDKKITEGKDYKNKLINFILNPKSQHSKKLRKQY